MAAPQLRAVASLLLLGVACSDPTRAPAVRVASLTIAAAPDELYPGEADQLHFEARDEAGAVVDGVQPVWTSSDTVAATVSSGGLLLARRQGTALLSAAVGAVSDSRTVRILPAPAVLTLTASPGVLAMEDTTALGIVVLDSSGVALPAPRLLLETADSAVAYLTTDGRLVPVAGGLTTIRVTAWPLTQQFTVKVVEFAQLTTGDAHTCALTTQGEAYCWGYNTGSRLGDSSTVTRDAPVPVLHAPGTFASIVAGGEHSCALRPGGSTYCWGWGGTGSTTVQPTPTPRDAPVFTALAAGRYLSCGLTDAGQAQCWGHQLWHGTPVLLASPTRVPAEVPFKHVDFGRDHGCALDADGRAFCWGANGKERLGFPGQPTDSARAVRTTDRFIDVAAGFEHSCAITTSGELRCWGRWPYLSTPGPLGARAIAAPELLTSVSTESEYTCALSVSGRAYCMGPSFGLGDLIAPVVDMQPVLGGLHFVAVEAGSGHACGLTASGVVYCWGNDYLSQVVTWLVPTKMRPSS